MPEDGIAGDPRPRHEASSAISGPEFGGVAPAAGGQGLQAKRADERHVPVVHVLYLHGSVTREAASSGEAEEMDSEGLVAGAGAAAAVGSGWRRSTLRK